MDMNKTFHIGRLVADPTLTPANGDKKARAWFRIAVNRPYQSEQKADFMAYTTFGVNAENLARYCSKGKEVHIEGHIQSSVYERDGKTEFRTELIADRISYGSDPKKGQDQDVKALVQIALQDPEAFAALVARVKSKPAQEEADESPIVADTTACPF